MRTRSPSGVSFTSPMSMLLIPGVQQIERGALPMVPGGTVELVNNVGSKAKPLCCFTFHVWNGAVRFGSPGASKKILLNSSMSSEEVIRIGNPVWKVRIPDHSHPSTSLPVKPSYFGTGKAHT